MILAAFLALAACTCLCNARNAFSAPTHVCGSIIKEGREDENDSICIVFVETVSTIIGFYLTFRFKL